jgi:hypothetical protein
VGSEGIDLVDQKDPLVLAPDSEFGSALREVLSEI